MTNSKAVNMLMNSQYYEQGYKQGVSDVLGKIRAEIEKIPIAPFATAYTAKSEALKIIDKYKAENEG